MTERSIAAIPSSKAALDSPSQNFPLALTLVVGAGLSILAFFLVQRSERQRVERDFEWRSRSHAQALRVQLQRFEECLCTVRDLFRASTEVSYEEFAATVAELRARHRGIQQMQWIPRVKAEDRAAFEARARSEVWPAYQILERSRERLANVPSAEYPEYAPVYFVDPKVNNEVSFGFDAYRGAHAPFLDRARTTGLVAATPRLRLRDQNRREIGWGAFLALYSPGPMPTTVEERNARLQGFILGSYRLSDLIQVSIADAPSGIIEALFLDKTPGSPESYLIASQDGAWLASPPPAEADFQKGLHHHTRLDVGGRDWHIYFRPSPAWLAAQASHYPWMALGGVLVVTGLLGFLIHNAQRQAALVVRLVQERTAELRATQQTLREDIQQREATERALRESEDRYRAFVEQSTEAIWRIEHVPPIPTHLPVAEQIELIYRHARLAECNDVMARMYGYSRSEEMVGASLDQVAPRSDPQNVAYLRAFIEGGYRISDWETRGIDQDGQPKFFLNNETGVVEGGLLQRTWGTRRDITERKRQAELQVAQDTRLRLAVAAASLGTWDWDLRTGQIVWSEEAERIYGLEPGGFDGSSETFFSLIHPEDREKVRATIQRSLENPRESVGTYELRVLRPDGTMRWLVARGAVLRDGAGIAVRRLGTVMDVTAVHLAEEEKACMERKLQETQKLESLGILAGGIAHDFNNLLTGILGNASLARLELPTTSPAQTSLEQIELVAQRAADLCKQMLAYSGKGRFIVQRLDLSALVRDTAEFLRLSISKSAVLKFSLASDLPTISADATQMRQILMNLIINASEAIGERSGVITIATGLMHADRAYLTEAHLSPNIPEGEYVFLEVSDNGAGMDAATRARIFDPFFTTKFTGRGLGLAAVLGIVRGHSGALKVYSESGRGTTFKLLLPPTEGAPEHLPDGPLAHPAWQGRGTVLVVDDEETVRKVSARMLTAMGFDVLQAGDGHEALEIFRPRRGEIVGVLLDLTMPRLDGAATFAELRRLQPGLPVLLMSGFNEQDAINRFAEKGLAGFLQKPFKPETLRARLRAIFGAATSGATNLSLDPSLPRF